MLCNNYFEIVRFNFINFISAPKIFITFAGEWLFVHARIHGGRVSRTGSRLFAARWTEARGGVTRIRVAEEKIARQHPPSSNTFFLELRVAASFWLPLSAPTRWTGMSSTISLWFCASTRYLYLFMRLLTVIETWRVWNKNLKNGVIQLVFKNRMFNITS